ncbi:MAG TPA: pentapeptide repeat-containing protein [Herpetosiphonaceae bacterium]
MRSRFLIKRPSRRTVLVGTIVLGSLVVYGLMQVNYECDLTGFGACDFVKGSSDEDYRPEKTLWDWLGLLIVPTVLALGAIYFNRAERRNELEIAQQERLNELEIAQKERQNEARIAEERAQDARLQTYLDQMRELLLDRNLRDSQAGDEVRHVAQTLTLIALRRLDQERRNILMQFLRSSRLIGLHNGHELVDQYGNLLGAKARNIVDFQQVDLREADLRASPLFAVNLRGAILREANLRGAILYSADLSGTNLRGADLSGTNLRGANLYRANFYRANLRGADLSGTNLRGANLEGANLEGANLRGADLSRANLSRANLEGANLEGANLTGAIVTPEQLAQGASLTGASMPDGSIHD